MGALLDRLMFPAPRSSYTLGTLASPPLHMINGIPCLVYHPRLGPRSGVLIYFHCNGVDLGSIQKNMYVMAGRLGVTVIAMEYPGYGVHTGRASEASCMQAARKVMRHVLHSLGPNESLTVMGRSIGSGIAAALASERPRCTALVLLSPFASMRAVGGDVAGELGRAIVGGTFDTVRRLRGTRCPTLLLHGARDTLFRPSHSQVLLSASGSPQKELVVLTGCGHNDIDWAQVFTAMCAFLAPPRPL